MRQRTGACRAAKRSRISAINARASTGWSRITCGRSIANIDEAFAERPKPDPRVLVDVALADLEEAAVRREHRQALGDRLAGERVEHEVDAAPAGRREHFVREGERARVHHVRARRRARAGSRASRRCPPWRRSRRRQAARSGSPPGRRRRSPRGPAPARPRPICPRWWSAYQAVRNTTGIVAASSNESPRGMRATRPASRVTCEAKQPLRHRQHRVSLAEPVDAGPDARRCGPRIRRRSGRSSSFSIGIDPERLHHVAEVERRGAHLDLDLAPAGRRLGRALGRRLSSAPGEGISQSIAPRRGAVRAQPIERGPRQAVHVAHLAAQRDLFLDVLKAELRDQALEFASAGARVEVDHPAAQAPLLVLDDAAERPERRLRRRHFLVADLLRAARHEPEPRRLRRFVVRTAPEPDAAPQDSRAARRRSRCRASFRKAAEDRGSRGARSHPPAFAGRRTGGGAARPIAGRPRNDRLPARGSRSPQTPAPRSLRTQPAERRGPPPCRCDRRARPSSAPRRPATVLRAAGHAEPAWNAARAPPGSSARSGARRGRLARRSPR